MGEPADLVLTTERTAVRRWRASDLPRYYDMMRRWDVARWLGSDPKTLDLDAANARLERLISGAEDDARYGSWAVVDAETGIVAGCVLLMPLPNGAGEIEIGWHLHPDAWGRGLATEAASGVLDKAFADGHDEVWAVTYPDNVASQRVCRRLGLQPQGPTTRWYGVAMLSYRITREARADVR